MEPRSRLEEPTTFTLLAVTPRSLRKRSSVSRPDILTYNLAYLLMLDDATSASSKLKGERVSAKDAQKQGEEWAQIAGSKVDQTVNMVNLIFTDAG